MSPWLSKSRLQKDINRDLNPSSSSILALPEGLGQEERAMYKALLRVVKGRHDNNREAPHVVVITDLAKDYDDLVAMVTLAELHRLGVVRLLGFIANLAPARKRALFGRGALDLLRLPQIPIAFGTKGSENYHAELAHEFDCTFLAPEDTHLESGEKLLHQLCSEAVKTEQKLTFLLISSLQDISEFSQRNPELFKNATSNIVLQGGYNVLADGTLQPDMAAANNRFDQASAIEFYKFMQESQIPLVVYTKVAAFATPLTSKLFAELEATGHPLGKHLRRVQVTQDLAFYRQASSEDPTERFAPFMDQKWFLKNRTSWFDSPHDPHDPLPIGEEVIPYLTKALVYDALAALGTSGPDTLRELGVLKPTSTTRHEASVHEIVGSQSDPGIDPLQMAKALTALLKGSLLASQQELSGPKDNLAH
jgi:hypothetical protein